MYAQQAWLLIQQGFQHFNRGDYSRALSCFEQAATQAYASGDTSNELLALSWLSVTWCNLMEYAKAIEVATRQLARARQVKDENHEMRATLNLATGLAGLDARGRWREIRPLLLDGLATARRLSDSFQEVKHLAKLSEFAVRVGELDAGMAWSQEALTAITSELEGAYLFRYNVYSNLSSLMLKRGNAAEAVRYAEMAVAEARLDGNPDFVADAQLLLAHAEQARGERVEALRLVEEVAATASAQEWKGEQQAAEWLRSVLERELGHPEVAEGAAWRALELARELKLKEEEVESLLSLGQALAALGRKDEAREALQQARRLSQERDYPDHFATAERLLQGGA